MTATTALGAALARLAGAPGDTALRLAMFDALADAELIVLLEAEAEPGTLAPRVYPAGEGPVVLAFDTEGALADFAGPGAPYAAVPGRVLAPMLAAQGLSLLVQAQGGAAELLPPRTLDWFRRALTAPAPRPTQGSPAGFGPPALPPATLAALLPALERRLCAVPGIAGAALAAARWPEGASGPDHLLAVSGVALAAQPPLARALAEAMAFAGLAPGALDLAFVAAPTLDRIAAQGIALNTAPPEPAAPAAATPPGMDPARPPKLR